MSPIMNYRKLGHSGLSISELSFGSWITFGRQVQLDDVKSMFKHCLDSGINFFDNAEVYSNGQSEEIMGDAFRKLGIKRNEYVISTKFFWGIENRVNFKNTLNRKYLTQAIEGSLKRLQLDYVDIVYCHRYDPETPIPEIVLSMDQMIKRGQALYWGTSEWPAQAIDQAYDFAVQHGLNRPIVEQPQYNLLHREKVEIEFSDLYKKAGLGLTTWSPLASGLLTGKYLDGIPEGSRASIPTLAFVKEEALNEQKTKRIQKLYEISKETGVSMPHLAIGWCLLNPNVSSVILGASKIEQLKDNLKVLEKMNQIREIKNKISGI